MVLGLGPFKESTTSFNKLNIQYPINAITITYTIFILQPDIGKFEDGPS
jgi:hypothetical protein